jgi:indolepyruvate ferredoxin oxidoreductase
MIRELLSGLTPGNLAAVADIACLPDRIRGYEQIKLDSIEAARQAASEMRARLSRPVAA